MNKNIKKIDEKSLEKSLKNIWQNSKTDPNGSYTGTAENSKEETVQDQDDL